MSKFKSWFVVLMIAGCASRGASDEETLQTTDEGYQGEAQPDSQPPRDEPELPASIPPITAEQYQQPSGNDTDAEDQGQWVYTQQYGWLWMPYSDDYIYTPDESSGGSPFAYVYYPNHGWTWLEAPWVWGSGAEPFFSDGGFRHRFFREAEREHFRGERFRGGFHQPPGFRVPAVTSRSHGRPMAMRAEPLVRQLA